MLLGAEAPRAVVRGAHGVADERELVDDELEALVAHARERAEQRGEELGAVPEQRVVLVPRVCARGARCRLVCSAGADGGGSGGGGDGGSGGAEESRKRL